jgi:hypothetical protein
MRANAIDALHLTGKAAQTQACAISAHTSARSRNVDEQSFRKIAQLPSLEIHNQSARPLRLNKNTERGGLDGNSGDPVPGYGPRDFNGHRSGRQRVRLFARLYRRHLLRIV